MEARSLSSVKCVCGGGGLVRPQKRLQDVLSSCKTSTLFNIILKEVSFTAEGEEARRRLRAKVSPTVSIFIHIIDRVGVQLFIIPSYLFRVCKIRNDVSCFGPDLILFLWAFSLFSVLPARGFYYVHTTGQTSQTVTSAKEQHIQAGHWVTKIKI